MKRFFILLAGVMIQVCLGGIYAWSVFVKPLINEFQFSIAQTQLIFGVIIATFSLSMILAGRLQDKHGPKIIAFIGGLLFGTGYIAASLSRGNFLFLLIFLGFIGGAGIGFGYVCPLATGIKWFPKQKGLITGISVAGFGGGAVLLSTVSQYLITAGWSILEIFLWIGISYGIVVCLCALVLSVPDDKGVQKKVAPSFTHLLRDGYFWALFTGMFAGTFSGLLVVGNLKPFGIFLGFSEGAAFFSITVFAFGNAAGRISWGWICDRIGDVKAIVFSLLLQAAGLLLILYSGNSKWLFAGLIIILGFNFGACFVLYATGAAHRYGRHVLGSVYSLIFLSYGISGIAGPFVGGWIYDITQNYVPAFYTAAALCVLGSICFIILSNLTGHGKKT